MQQIEQEDIIHKKIASMRVVSHRTLIKDRNGIQSELQKLISQLPSDSIIGPGFAIYHYGTSIPEGYYDIEVCVQVKGSALKNKKLHIRKLEAVEVLSTRFQGDFDKKKLIEQLQKLFSYFEEHLILVCAKDMRREIYWDNNNPQGTDIEMQIKIHDWNNHLKQGITAALGKQISAQIMAGSEKLQLESSIQEKHQWLKQALESLDRMTTEEQKYQIVSHCAHEFAPERIESLRAVFLKGMKEKNNFYQAIDAVIEAMSKDPAWYETPIREGNIIYTKKVPYNAEGFNKAESPQEKLDAYCHCTIVRKHLNIGIPSIFCYCGSGWYKQTWEGVIGKPVTIKLLKSLLKGDSYCQFAIHLPEMIS